jgi:hypothetical protein
MSVELVILPAVALAAIAAGATVLRKRRQRRR